MWVVATVWDSTRGFTLRIVLPPPWHRYGHMAAPKCEGACNAVPTDQPGAQLWKRGQAEDRPGATAERAWDTGPGGDEQWGHKSGREKLPSPMFLSIFICIRVSFWSLHIIYSSVCQVKLLIPMSLSDRANLIVLFFRIFLGSLIYLFFFHHKLKASVSHSKENPIVLMWIHI